MSQAEIPHSMNGLIFLSITPSLFISGYAFDIAIRVVTCATLYQQLHLHQRQETHFTSQMGHEVLDILIFIFTN